MIGCSARAAPTRCLPSASGERLETRGFIFSSGNEETRSLFDAIAEMTTLMPMVRELEARLAADARAASLDATQGPARSCRRAASQRRYYRACSAIRPLWLSQ